MEGVKIKEAWQGPVLVLAVPGSHCVTEGSRSCLLGLFPLSRKQRLGLAERQSPSSSDIPRHVRLCAELEVRGLWRMGGLTVGGSKKSQLLTR